MTTIAPLESFRTAPLSLGETPKPPPRRAHLASEATQTAVRRYVARRVGPADVDDVVQATLCDALASDRAPAEAEDFHRWVLAIARFKVVDAHRAASRARTTGIDDLAADSPPFEARSLLRWAERNVPRGAEATLRWMMREADGDKLEHIAADERLPAVRVRQRVSRLRRWLRGRWLAEMALVAVLAIAIGAVVRGRREAILPELEAASSPVDPSLVGSWRLMDFMPAEPLSAARQALLDRWSPDLTATFDGRTLRMIASRDGLERAVTADGRGGRLEAIDAQNGARVSGSYAWVGDDLVLTVTSGPWAGVARLRKTR